MFRKFFDRLKKDRQKVVDLPAPKQPRVAPEPEQPFGTLPKKKPEHELSEREYQKRKNRMRMAKESRRKNRS